VADDKETEWLHQRPAVAADTVFLAGWDKQVYAVDRRRARSAGSSELNAASPAHPCWQVTGSCWASKTIEKHPDRKPGYGLYAIDIATGEAVWQVHTDKHVHIPPPSRTTCFMRRDDRLRALDARDGHELWQVALPEKLRAGPLIV
jgi:outer membrane protein assembly factor BamB